VCEIYSGIEPELFELKTRSIRIDSVVTSVRLVACRLYNLSQWGETFSAES